MRSNVRRGLAGCEGQRLAHGTHSQASLARTPRKTTKG